MAYVLSGLGDHVPAVLVVQVVRRVVGTLHVELTLPVEALVAAKRLLGSTRRLDYVAGRNGRGDLEEGTCAEMCDKRFVVMNSDWSNR